MGTATHGTARQATALVKILNDVRRKTPGKGNLTPSQVVELTARVKTMTQAEVRAEFNRLNAITGFDRHTSPATVDQRRRIYQLELISFGKSRTSYRDELTFMQASDLISGMVDELDKRANAPTADMGDMVTADLNHAEKSDLDLLLQVARSGAAMSDAVSELVERLTIDALTDAAIKGEL